MPPFVARSSGLCNGHRGIRHLTRTASMRGFPDVLSREPMKARFYEGKLWKGELERALMPMLEKYEVAVIDDPQGLVRW